MASHARLTWESLTLKLRNPFTISYGTSDTRQAFWLRLAGDEGWGEGTIPPYYGVDTAEMTATWQRAAESSLPLPDDLAGIPAWVGSDGPAVARCALDLALHDRIGRRSNLPVPAAGAAVPAPAADLVHVEHRHARNDGRGGSQSAAGARPEDETGQR
jgi:L-alanine-DL-glutamate epimerase-like enolase superfamily enzyme